MFCLCFSFVVVFTQFVVIFIVIEFSNQTRASNFINNYIFMLFYLNFCFCFEIIILYSMSCVLFLFLFYGCLTYIIFVALHSDSHDLIHREGCFPLIFTGMFFNYSINCVVCDVGESKLNRIINCSLSVRICLAGLTDMSKT